MAWNRSAALPRCLVREQSWTACRWERVYRTVKAFLRSIENKPVHHRNSFRQHQRKFLDIFVTLALAVLQNIVSQVKQRHPPGTRGFFVLKVFDRGSWTTNITLFKLFSPRFGGRMCVSPMVHQPWTISARCTFKRNLRTVRYQRNGILGLNKFG